MRIIIHRGTKEVGGSCVELEAQGERVLVDFGLPLVDENKEPFDAKKLKGKSIRELVKEKVLPDVAGLYKNETPSVKAILISHPHPDHSYTRSITAGLTRRRKTLRRPTAIYPSNG